MLRAAVITLVVAVTTSLSAQAPAPLQVPYRQFQLANGLNVILHQDKTVPVVAVNIWYHVGSANEKPGRTGFAHLFEHLMFEGSKHVKEGQFDTLLEARRRRQQRVDVERPHQLRHRRAVERARARAVPRVRSHGVPPRHDAARTGQQPARRRQERAAPELREPPYGMASIELDKMLWPPNHPYNWPVIGYMEDLTAATSGRRRRVLQEVLRASQRQPRRRRRHRLRPDAGAGRKVVQRRARWHASRARRTAGGHPQHRQAEDAHRSGVPAAALSRLDHACASTRRATPRSTSPRRCWPAARTRVSTSDSSTTRRWRRTSRPTRSRPHSAARSRSSPPPGPVTPSPSCRRRSTRSSSGCAREPPTAREVQRAVNQIEASFYRRDGTCRRLRRQGRSAERLLRGRRRPGLLRRGPGALHVALRVRRAGRRRRWLPADRRVELVVQPEVAK